MWITLIRNITPLSRWRERAGVRVNKIMDFPLTFILSPKGRGETGGHHLSKKK